MKITDLDEAIFLRDDLRECDEALERLERDPDLVCSLIVGHLTFKAAAGDVAALLRARSFDVRSKLSTLGVYGLFSAPGEVVPFAPEPPPAPIDDTVGKVSAAEDLAQHLADPETPF